VLFNLPHPACCFLSAWVGPYQGLSSLIAYSLRHPTVIAGEGDKAG